MAGTTQKHSRTMTLGQLHHHGTRADATARSPDCGEGTGSVGGIALIAGLCAVRCRSRSSVGGHTPEGPSAKGRYLAAGWHPTFRPNAMKSLAEAPHLVAWRLRR